MRNSNVNSVLGKPPILLSNLGELTSYFRVYTQKKDSPLFLFC